MFIDWQNPVTRHRLNEGLVGWWLSGSHPPFWGTNTWRDLVRPAANSGGNHGTLSGFTAGGSHWGGALGRPGGWGRLTFDGTDDFMSAPVSSRIGSAAAATVTGWIYRTATGTLNAFGYGDDVGADRFNLIWFSDNKVYCQADGGTFPSFTSTATGWHFLAHVYDGGAGTKQRAYLDGAPQTLAGGQTPNATLASAANLGAYWAGRESQNGFCAGAYDSLRAYDRALGDVEIWHLYQEERTGYPNLLNRIRRSYYVAQEEGAAATLASRLSLLGVGV